MSEVFEYITHDEIMMNKNQEIRECIEGFLDYPVGNMDPKDIIKRIRSRRGTSVMVRYMKYTRALMTLVFPLVPLLNQSKYFM